MSVSIAGELGVQSYCFRHFKDNRKVAELTRQCGLDRIELGGGNMDLANPGSWGQVLKIYGDAGVKIVGLGVQRMMNDPAKERAYFEFVKAAGAKFMSVTFSVDAVPAAYRAAEKLADEYDVKLAIHNHGGRDWLGCSAMLAHVFRNTSPRIGLCLDTAWAMDSGEDPVAVAEKFGDRLYGLHVKDFTFDSAGKGHDVVVGTGNLDLRKLAETLRKVNFAGYAVLEYEAEPENPVPAIQQCVRAVRERM
jgi:sugar phosphate isomerase/epimerase